MRLQTLPVDRLNPAPYNPRLPLKPGDPGWIRLERSLREFDVVQPIVWNERTGHVVSGHQRLEILKHQGHREVDCVVVDLSLEREQALNVALNNSRVGSDWDPDKLVNLVSQLQDLPDFDATLTGFNDQELRDLLLEPVPLDPESEEADEEETIEVTLTCPPDSWAGVEKTLNELLAHHTDVRLHVRSPL